MELPKHWHHFDSKDLGCVPYARVLWDHGTKGVSLFGTLPSTGHYARVSIHLSNVSTTTRRFNDEVTLAYEILTYLEYRRESVLLSPYDPNTPDAFAFLGYRLASFLGRPAYEVEFVEVILILDRKIGF